MTIGWGEGGVRHLAGTEVTGWERPTGSRKVETETAQKDPARRKTMEVLWFFCVFLCFFGVLFFFLARFIQQFSLAGNKSAARFELGGWD